MTFTDALAATAGTRRIARPVSGLRDGCGYYVAEGRVWWYDRTELGADLRVRVKPADWLPPWDVLRGEWEAVER